jgi:light-regulated signal transduction histidine kinase (bacteriophytochrome)
LKTADGRLEQRVAERTAQLQSANKELEAFCYSVSHDLRAPLRHIAGFAELLGAAAGGVNESGKRYVQKITQAATRMGQLIDDLLVFSRIGRTEMQTVTVDLGDLLAEVLKEAQPDLKGRQIDWQIGPLPTVRGDPSTLRLALANLVSNAVKYTGTRERPRIEIGVGQDTDRELVIFVRDNGVGFDMQYASKLFGVFQRLHRAEEFEGTGIGLANVRRIIDRHGGRTWAEGESGRGAAFYFSLPKDREAAA